MISLLSTSFQRFGSAPRSLRMMATWALADPPKLPTLKTPSDNAQARAWIAQFKTHKIPRDVVELSFARSSGPGGQNVNKVNTKATVRCPLHSRWIPLWAYQALRKTPHYVASGHSLLVTSTVSRSQAQNVTDCLSKLHAIVLSASSADLINEPSEEQKKKVRALEKAENMRRRQEKAHRSAVKRGRAAGEWD